jgi:hypothetical protein
MKEGPCLSIPDFSTVNRETSNHFMSEVPAFGLMDAGTSCACSCAPDGFSGVASAVRSAVAAPDVQAFWVPATPPLATGKTRPPFAVQEFLCQDPAYIRLGG